MRSYFKEIDIVKGITILLVILGHCFCTFPLNLNEEFPILGTIVRSFQMPLFFVASGFLFSTQSGWESLIKRKAIRLLVPYLVFGILSLILRFVFGAITRGGADELSVLFYKLLNGELYWFLYTLILVMCVVQLIKSTFLLYIAAFICIILCLYTDIRLLNVMTLGKVVYYYPFFVFGMAIKRWYSQIMYGLEKNRSICVITLSLFFAIMLFVDMRFSLIGFSLYIIPIIGIFMVWAISKVLADYSNMVVDFFVHFGKYSLQYYLNHLLIMLPFYYIASFINFVHPIIPLLFIFVCAIVVSYIMLKIEKSTKVLRMFCGLSK